MRALKLTAIAVGTAPMVSVAHAAADPVASFATGFAHPIGGIDHILAMVTVGVWGALAGGRALWVWPTTFVATMLTGFAAAAMGLQLPWIGVAVSSSIIVLGLLVALAIKAPVWLGATLVGLFAFFHGYAHCTEAIAASLAVYGAGFALATAGLHVAGIGLAFAIEGSIGKPAVQAMGALTVIGGLALIGA